VSWQPFDEARWELWRDQVRVQGDRIVTCGGDGIEGFGEIAPLEKVAPVDLSKRWSALGPSERWGIETACIHWMAKATRISPPHLLTESPLALVERQALIWAERPELRPGFDVMKVKVGRQSPELDAAVLHALQAKKLRLDANGRSVARLWELCRGLPIEYVEDPLETDPFPVAQDDALRGGRVPLPQAGVVAWAVKPAQFGGWGELLRLSQLAKQRGLTFVVSMSHETEIGWSSLVAAAAALHAPGVAAGLDGHRLELGSKLRIADVFADYA
jgi:L-alanine-DL-glutamate epimerase-like enolase superfamily enzyme